METLQLLRMQKAHLAKTYGVTSIGVFGSVLREDFTDASDIDIAVELDSTHKTMKDFLGLKRYLEELFGREVDVGIESALKPAVRERVREEMVYV